MNQRPVSIRITPTQQEVLRDGTYFTLSKIKSVFRKFVGHKYMEPFVIHRRFNPVSGETAYKYAWDSALYQMNNDGTLDKILDHLLSLEDGEGDQ